jgi:CHAT domain-containing protein
VPYLKKTKKVYFCPDGVYNQLSLNTLQNPETNKFLSEETNITIVGNLKDIFQENSNNTDKTAEIFGRPDYKKGNKKDENKEQDKERGVENSQNLASFANIKTINFVDLVGTETEVKGIASNLKQESYKVGLFLGADAVEEQVKATNSPKILHISTHGYFVPSDSKNKINGMLSSGIVLAGVNDTTENVGREDGILTAYEASTLDLDNTDLVVLSACETGLGEVATGEGVYGLQRGFKVAGADAVLMSLWKVDDKATQELMNLFYTNWLKTGNKRQALLAAQATLREKYKFPYYWGAFVLVGE